MDKKVKTAPYLPFQTFTSALDNIAANSVPNVIDRHSFPSFSGAAVSSTLIALKFFGLIDDDGKPEDALHSLVMDKDGRKVAIKALLEKHYSNVFAIDLTRATPPQFDGAFTAELYNISGDTKTKAKTFFIKAAQFADIPMSKMLITKSRTSGARKPRKPKGDAGGKATGSTAVQPPAQQSGKETSKTIEFSGGGKLTLTLDVNILELKGTDRTFVFDLIDKIEAYQDSTPNAGDKG
jgi:hypothetical protein